MIAADVRLLKEKVAATAAGVKIIIQTLSELREVKKNNRKKSEIVKRKCNSWVCTKCTGLNPIDLDNCRFCSSNVLTSATTPTRIHEAVVPETGGLYGSRVNDDCNDDEYDDEKKGNESQPKPETWTCKRCTFVNSSCATKCICRDDPSFVKDFIALVGDNYDRASYFLGQLGVRVEANLPKPAMWECKRCTMVNDGFMIECVCAADPSIVKQRTDPSIANTRGTATPRDVSKKRVTPIEDNDDNMLSLLQELETYNETVSQQIIVNDDTTNPPLVSDRLRRVSMKHGISMISTSRRYQTPPSRIVSSMKVSLIRRLSPTVPGAPKPTLVNRKTKPLLTTICVSTWNGFPVVLKRRCDQIPMSQITPLLDQYTPTLTRRNRFTQRTSITIHVLIKRRYTIVMMSKWRCDQRLLLRIAWLIDRHTPIVTHPNRFIQPTSIKTRVLAERRYPTKTTPASVDQKRLR